VGTIPFFLLTVIGYWAYGNLAAPYLLINLSGPKWALTLANVTALLQALVVFHVSNSTCVYFLHIYISVPKKDSGLCVFLFFLFSFKLQGINHQELSN
jgi:hypothetical protein